MRKIEELVDYIQELHDKNAIHKKRGFVLQDTTPLIVSNHLLEEVVELQAEAVVEGNIEKSVEESADVLANFLYLLCLLGIDFGDVIDCCNNKLKDVFVFDETEVLTNTPGFSRRHREGNPEA